MRRFFLFFIVLLSVSGCYLDPYEEHFQLETAPERIFSGAYESRDYTVWSLPDATKITAMTDMIRNAKDRVWIEVYILTEKSIIAELYEAKKRGVDVEIILERNVYGTPFIHESLFEQLQDAGIAVVWANNDFFTFTHAKFFIIDSTFFISTGNLSYSTFTKNREFVVVSENSSDLAILEAVFRSDFSHKKIFPTSSTLIFSPTDSRSRILAFLDSTDTSLDMSMQSLTDPEIIDRLQILATRGVQIRLCLAENDQNDLSFLTDSFSGKNITIGMSKSPYIHAKAMVSDGNDIFIGSMNFTTNALDNNREVGAIFHADPSVGAEISDSLHEDCKI